ncbi:MAG: hypothetical protein H7233_07195, partial [Pseudorhodobacter sp.]|nr:hypothetical protein [Frankiaceae bacterium]
AKATTGTIRAQLINIPGRLAHSARTLTLHLPTDWPWQSHWEQLRAGAAPRRGLNPSTAAHGPTERPENAGPAGYAGTPRLA